MLCDTQLERENDGGNVIGRYARQNVMWKDRVRVCQSPERDRATVSGGLKTHRSYCKDSTATTNNYVGN